MEIKFNTTKSVGYTRKVGCDNFILGLDSSDYFLGQSSSKYTENTECIATLRNNFTSKEQEYNYSSTETISFTADSSKPSGEVTIGWVNRQFYCYSWKIYYFKLWQDDKLVFYGIPVLNSFDNKTTILY